MRYPFPSFGGVPARRGGFSFGGVPARRGGFSFGGVPARLRL